jgi:hypothetical protein
MAIVRELELGRELVTALNEINEQQEAIRKVALELGCFSYQVRDTNGNFMMAPILAAKCQLLHGLVLINDRKK